MTARAEQRSAEATAGADRFLWWSAIALMAGLVVHGIDHIVLRGMDASPTAVAIGGNIQSAFVVVAVVMTVTRRRRAAEFLCVAGFGSAALFLYAHILPTIWPAFSDSFVSPPHLHVTWYSWVSAAAEIGAGLVAGVAAVRALRARTRS